ncbi:MAG: DUF4430 domain-containing protein [Clostridia bacterium]|nr:DUF4430 domain-containing protein [Clostridia bacterium]
MKKLSLLLILVLLFTLASCKTEIEKPDTDTQNNVSDSVEGNVSDPLWEDALFLEDTTFGEGKKKIEVEVKAGEKSITFTVNTDAETLADALLEHSLIEGEDSAYGIYIKKVNGILADYDIDGYYWSLLKNGEYLMTGADSTEIADSEHYELVRTK